MPGKLNLAEAAEYLGCKPRTLYNWIHDKQRGKPPLRHFKFMGKLYFDKKDLDAYRRQLTIVKAG